MSKSPRQEADISSDPSDKEFSCPTCNQTFGNEAGVKQHHYAAHGESIAGVEIICDWCGNCSTMRPSQVSEHNFCNRECWSDWNAEHLTDKVEYPCDYCGDTFEIHPFRLEEADKHFCPNDNCYGKWQSENNVGESARHWKGGRPKYYGPNWKRQRTKVLDRDQHQCQSCGKDSGELNTEPHVHHIQPLRKFQQKYEEPKCFQEGNAIENLVTLCKSCHNRWEGIPLKPQLI